MTNVAFKHLVRIEDLSTHEVQLLIERALVLKHKAMDKVESRSVLASNLFFESSTRTHRSFEVAQRKMGLEVIQFDPGTCSLNKGETLYDTVLTLDALGIEILVIRHPDEQFYEPLLKSSSLQCSIINGGDGTGEHPTQCLLDVMTIYEHFQCFKGLEIIIVGDLINSRVAHSNAKLLSRLGAKLYFSGPKEWQDETLKNYGTYVELDDVLQDMDVVMLLRVQKERHVNQAFTQASYHQAFGLTETRYLNLKTEAILMHPAPVNRNTEIADVCVEAPQSKIVEQMRNGVYMRMAILEAILTERKSL